MTSFNPAVDIPDLAGKTILVTGGNAGIGAETVKAIAAHNPARLFLCARTPSKADAFIQELRKQHPKTTTQAVTLDLASFDSIRACAKQVNEACDKIDILILNAGVSALSAQLTKEGYEIQTGTNHVGHALLTQLLMPKLVVASEAPGADTRIVVVASKIGQSSGALPISGLKTDMASTGTMNRYGYSKLANIYFAKSLAKQYPSITTTALHPGVVYTEIWGKADGFQSLLISVAKPLVRWFGLTAADGAKNQLWCSFAKGVESGKYYEPVGKLVTGSKIAGSDEERDKFWDWTNKELAAHGAPGWR